MMRKAIFGLAIACVAWESGAAASSDQTLRYTILMNGRAAGSEVDTYSADGRIDSEYEYNDRGRGPKIAAHYAFADDGRPVRVDVSGVDYYKAPVDEHFARDNGKAQWKSTSEHGESSSPGFYITVNGSNLVDAAHLVNALSQNKGQPLPLLPAGEARLERVAETTVESHGEKLHVTEFAITGLSFTPVTIWLDDHGNPFGSPGKWVALLRAGWEDTNETLYQLERKNEDARYERLARNIAQHPGRPVAIEHVRLFDSEHAMMREDQTVLIDGERIAAVGAAAGVDVPAGAERIDGRGKTLLPGLFDMHVHLQPLDGLLHIASGVTSTRDMGNDIEQLGHLQKRWDSGTAIGPRVWKAGLIDGRGRYQAPAGIYADTPEEANAAVQRYADLGYIQIKIYSSLKPELVPGIAKAAHARGLRVSGHVPNGMIASQFIEDGADELQHMNFIFLNFLAGQVKDTRTPERFTAVAANAAKLDLHSKPVEDFIQLMRQHGTTADITLGIFGNMFTARPGQIAPDLAPVLIRLPAQVQRGALTGGLPVTAANDQLYNDSYQAMLLMAKQMYDAGIPILAGTDSTAGIMLHRELEVEVDAGIPPLMALQIATWKAARLLKTEGELGSI
ncbi:MAG: amidohydrolase family protein, partial [Acidobacteriaceae bacterium]|nr:amidohydrolase family protein [Acidobacteriaceae bacterium]